MEYSQAFTVVFGVNVNLADSDYIARCYLAPKGKSPLPRLASIRCAVSRLIREAAMQAPRGERSALLRELKEHSGRLQEDLEAAARSAVGVAD